MSEDIGQAGTEAAQQSDAVGEWLRQRREQLGLPVAAVAAALHLDRPIVEALEQENFSAIGAAVFVKGHLRAVAQHLGLDPLEAIRRYNASAGAAASEPPALIVSYNRPRGRNGEKAVFAVVSVIALVALLLAWMFWPGNGSKPAPPARDPVSEADGVADREPATGSPVEAASAAPAVAAGAGATDFTAMLEQARAGSASSGRDTTATQAAAPASGAPEQGLRLTFSAECWYEVRDANGVRLAIGTGNAGSSRLLSGARPFSLTLGVADAVSVSLDGRPVTIEATDRRGRAARLTVR